MEPPEASLVSHGVSAVEQRMLLCSIHNLLWNIIINLKIYVSATAGTMCSHHELPEKA
jgi:hypothetical protein